MSSPNGNSSPDITTTTSVSAAGEGNDEAQKRVKTSGNEESEAIGRNAKPGDRTNSGRVVKMHARYLD